MNLLLWALAPVVFVAVWCGFSWVFSFLSGWQTLAKRFRANEKPSSCRAQLNSLQLNGSQYKGAVFLGVCDEGLFLSALFLFRVGHAPLLIPWSEFGPFKTSKTLWLSVYTTQIEVARFQKVALGIHDAALMNAIETRRTGSK